MQQLNLKCFDHVTILFVPRDCPEKDKYSSVFAMYLVNTVYLVGQVLIVGQVIRGSGANLPSTSFLSAVI